MKCDGSKNQDGIMFYKGEKSYKEEIKVME
jgi:hypothetical protein